MLINLVFKFNFLEPVKSCFGEISSLTDLKPHRKTDEKYQSSWCRYEYWPNHARPEFDYGRASLDQTANGNENIGSSGVQEFQNGDEEDFFCAGAGFSKAPKVRRLENKSEPPQTYYQGLMGGKGYQYPDEELEGGFGGGGATFTRLLNRQWKVYYGCGGGYTGGSSRIRNDEYCDGGGGGSFAADPNATFDYKFEKFGKCKIKFLNWMKTDK